ncbi:MAG: ribosome maturation factor RimP [Rickettsiales bacterium]|nr:ribosome maturation factor RimP [Rickettsiales bacterium]
MANAKQIDDMIRPALEDMGFEIVQLTISGQANRPTLQILAEKMPANEDVSFDDDLRVTVDECQLISKTVSALLDVEDPFNDPYMLEVGSPGIDRPLVKLRDYKRFLGHEAKIEAPFVIEDRKRYRGIIEAVEDNVITLKDGGQEFLIPFEKIERGKLILTDELLNAYSKKKEQ